MSAPLWASGKVRRWAILQHRSTPITKLMTPQNSTLALSTAARGAPNTR